MINKKQYLWERETITIDDDGFHVPNDHRNGVIRQFLKYVIDPDLEGKVDEVFGSDSDGFANGFNVCVYRITEIEDLDNFIGVLENNPEDWEFIKQEEIWVISIDDYGVQAIRGEDLRYLVHEAREALAEREKKIRHRTWWRR